MANVSHDLRTPLSLIYSYAEMMQDFPEEVTAEHSQVIMDEAKRLTSLVNDIMDISSFEMGVEKLNIKEYNLTKSLEKTIERIGEFIKKENYKIEFIYDTPINIFADEVKITQAFYNLLLNAVDHCGDNKNIIVKQTIIEDTVKVEVIDSGEGINAEELPYIWEHYYKVDKEHKRPIIGTGLGLSIVKKIAEIHSGTYGVKSDIGKGSSFWFQLKIRPYN